MAISNDNLVDNITIFDTIQISFELQLQSNWTCEPAGDWCNVLKIGTPTSTGEPKLPKIALRSSGLHMAITDNGGKTAYTVDDAQFMDTHNDGASHLYQYTLSPTERVISFDHATVLDVSGNFAVSDFVGTAGANYSLTVSPDSPYSVPNGTVSNLCITTYAATGSPTADPTADPTVSPSASECAMYDLKICSV